MGKATRDEDEKNCQKKGNDGDDGDGDAGQRVQYDEDNDDNGYQLT